MKTLARDIAVIWIAFTSTVFIMELWAELLRLYR